MTTENQASSSTAQMKSGRDILFWLVLLYLLTFYAQPGGRVAILGKIRFEFLLGAGLMVTLFVMRAKRMLTNEVMNRAVMCFFVVLCLSFVGAMQSHTVTEAVPMFIRIAKALCVYFMIIGTIDSESKLRKFAWTYSLAMLIIVGEPFLLSLQGRNLYVREGGMLRLYGVGQFESPNGLGTLAVMNLAFLYYFFFFYRSLWIRAFLAAFALVSLRVIMLTGSRTAYVALFILAACLFALSRRKPMFVVVGVLVVMLLLPFVADVYKERFFSLKQVVTAISSEEGLETSIGGRWYLFKLGFRVWLEYPIFGCGLDSFRHVVHKYGSWMQSHNLLTQVLSNTGLVGLAGFSYLIYSIVRMLSQTRPKLVELEQTDGFLYCLNGILLAFLLTRLITGLIGQHILYANSWWIIGGLATVSNGIVADMSAVDEQTLEDGRSPRAEQRPVRAMWNMVSKSHE